MSTQLHKQAFNKRVTLANTHKLRDSQSLLHVYVHVYAVQNQGWHCLSGLDLHVLGVGNSMIK